MQLTLRIDDNNFITLHLLTTPSGDTGPDAVPEVGAASIADSKLSNISQDQLLALTADALDYLQAEKSPAQASPAGDWFTNEWLPATKNGS